MSEHQRGADPDPSRWADPVATYDLVAPNYAAKFLDELSHKPFDRQLLDRFADWASGRVDGDIPVGDLGSGPGHIGAYLAGRGLPVEGIDLSAGMVAQARRCFPDLRFSTGDMTALDRPDGAFGGLVCFYALIHVPRQRVPVALAEMHRTLVEGGGLLVSAHGGQGTLHAEEMLEHAVSLDATLFSLDELSGLVQGAGFEIREAHERPPYEEELATPRLYVWATRP